MSDWSFNRSAYTASHPKNSPAFIELIISQCGRLLELPGSKERLRSLTSVRGKQCTFEHTVNVNCLVISHEALSYSDVAVVTMAMTVCC